LKPFVNLGLEFAVQERRPEQDSRRQQQIVKGGTFPVLDPKKVTC
jgi:hypothetical protein